MECFHELVTRVGVRQHEGLGKGLRKWVAFQAEGL